MSVLTEHIVLSRSKVHDLCNVKKLNCWGNNLTDISIVRQMTVVEVLSLSLNSITSLADFAHCSCLKELYLRKNSIENLNELYHLKDLQHLQSLSLEDNPCAQKQNYRLTVLRILPNLKVLDNISVQSDEVTKALTSGESLQHPVSTDPIPNPSAEANDTSSQGILKTCADVQEEIDWESYEMSTTSSSLNELQMDPFSSDKEMPSVCEDFNTTFRKTVLPLHEKAFHAKVQTMVDHPMTKAVNINRADICSISLEANPLELFFTDKTSAACLSDHLSNVSSTTDIYSHEFPNQHFSDSEDFKNVSRDRFFTSDDSSFPSPILPKHWKNMNSNLLSAVLCLVKELDCASLEVVKSAIRCRIDEIENN